LVVFNVSVPFRTVVPVFVSVPHRFVTPVFDSDVAVIPASLDVPVADRVFRAVTPVTVSDARVAAFVTFRVDA
jgi:hypothetical protein